MMTQEAMKARRAKLRNGISSVGLKTGRPKTRVMTPREIASSCRPRQVTRDVNTVVKIPMVRVMPKPRIGPEPMNTRIRAVSNVVRLASMIVQVARA